MHASLRSAYNEWIPTPRKDHRYLIEKMPAAELARVVEDLMMRPPGASAPRILQIYRDALKRGAGAAYGRIEEEAARTCRALGCPHPYLAIESLTGPKEVWFLNAYGSNEERKRVADDYARNRTLMAALEKIVAPKGNLVGTPVNLFATHRPGDGGGAWNMDGRFLVITETKGAPPADGAVFEAEDGTRFAIQPARTREQSRAKAAAVGPPARIFAVRPRMSLPAKEWTAADPAFWR
jgi:hypothetical protein